MGHLAQESVLLLLEIEQFLPQPLETVSQVLQVLRTIYHHWHIECAGPKPAYRRVDLLDWPVNQHREANDPDGRHRNQGKELPERNPLCLVSGRAHRLHLTVYQGGRMRVDDLGTVGQRGKSRDGLGELSVLRR